MVKITLKDFIFRANNIHKNYYDYSKFVYLNNKTKGIITCQKHGEFSQIPQDHLKGIGCVNCGHEKTGNRKRTTIDEFIKKSYNIHANLYDYSKVKYISSHKKITIGCSVHGNFFQTPHNHLLGKGCPKCNNSKGEMRISTFLTNKKIEFIPQKTFLECINPKTGYKLKFDFYIPSKKILIEYDGEQHFFVGYIGGNYFTTQKDLDELTYRDNIKTKFAKDTNISLFRINYKELNNIEYILSSIL